MRHCADAFLFAQAAVVVPATYGAVILANVVGSSFTLLSLGMKVGQARKSIPNAPQYPAMYAEGDSEDAKKFNCVQVRPLSGAFSARFPCGCAVFPCSVDTSKPWNHGRHFSHVLCSEV